MAFNLSMFEQKQDTKKKSGLDTSMFDKPKQGLDTSMFEHKEPIKEPVIDRRLEAKEQLLEPRIVPEQPDVLVRGLPRQPGQGEAVQPSDVISGRFGAEGTPRFSTRTAEEDISQIKTPSGRGFAAGVEQAMRPQFLQDEETKEFLRKTEEQSPSLFTLSTSTQKAPEYLEPITQERDVTAADIGRVTGEVGKQLTTYGLASKAVAGKEIASPLLKNLSPKAQQVVSTGLTDLIIDNIAQAPGNVIEAIEQDKSIDQVAKDLLVQNAFDIAFNAGIGVASEYIKSLKGKPQVIEQIAKESPEQLQAVIKADPDIVKQVQPLKADILKDDFTLDIPVKQQAELPKLIEDDNLKLRRTIHNSLMKSDLPDEMKKFFNDNPSLYKQITNTETMDKAIKNVADDYEGTLKKFNSKTALENAEDTTEAIAMLEKQSKESITDANKIALDLSEKATNSGQAIQALVMLQRNTPSGKLVQAHNVVKNAKKELLDDLPNTYKRMEKNGTLPYISDEDAKFILEKMEQAQKVTGREKDILLAQVDQLIADKIPVTLGDKLRALRNLSLLGNFKTIGTRNPLGNTIFGGLENLAQIPSGITDKMISSVLGTQRQTAVLPDIGKQLEGFKKGFGDAVSDIKLNIDTSPTRGGVELPRNRKVFEIAWLNKANNWLGDALKLGDRPYYQAAYEMRLAELKKLGAKATDEELERLASEFALQRVFQNKGRTSEQLAGFKRNLNKVNLERAGVDYGLGDVAMPYTETPANILAKSAEYTPLNLINIAGIATGGTKGATAGVGQFAKNIELNQKAFTDAIGRMFTGTGIMALGYGLAKNGHITGKSTEKGKARQLSRDMGERDYSIKIGDTWHSYDWAQPAAMPLAIGVDFYNAGITEGEFLNKIQKGTISGGNTMMEQSLLRGLTNMFGGQYSSPAQGISDTLLNAPTQYSPTFGSQIAQFGDPYKRDVNYEVPLPRMVESIQRRTPVLREQLRPQLDLLGQPKLEQDGRTGLERAFDVFINPSLKSEQSKNEILNEVNRLYDVTKDTDVIPSYTPPNLTRDQEYEFKQKFGQDTADELSKLFKSYSYRNASDESKAEMTSKLIRSQKTKIKKHFGY